jgi:hypothetical protein
VVRRFESALQYPSSDCEARNDEEDVKMGEHLINFELMHNKINSFFAQALYGRPGERALANLLPSFTHLRNYS